MILILKNKFFVPDVDRIVNFSPSLHAAWSLPFQFAVTLYLLHQQVGISYLAGTVRYISLHAAWSLPFQFAVTLYLLHQQVGISYLAGTVRYISLHAAWSLPFQFAVTLYLLHQQVGISYLAGTLSQKVHLSNIVTALLDFCCFLWKYRLEHSLLHFSYQFFFFAFLDCSL